MTYTQTMQKITSCLYLRWVRESESGGAKQVIRNFNVSPNLEDQQLLNYCILDSHGIKVKDKW